MFISSPTTQHSKVAKRRAARLLGMLCAIVFTIGQANAQTGTGVPATGGQTVTTVDRTKEYNVKSVYLYNFARYVEWPQMAGIPTDKFRIGVYGKSEIIKPLTKLAQIRTVTDKRTSQQHAIELREFKSVDECEPCHILFVSETTSKEEAAALLKRFEQQPVMVVGESEGFAQSGGTADFILQGKGIRFNLNLADSQTKHLKPDAKLLKAAHQILQGQKSASVIGNRP